MEAAVPSHARRASAAEPRKRGAVLLGALCSLTLALPLAGVTQSAAASSDPISTGAVTAAAQPVTDAGPRGPVGYGADTGVETDPERMAQHARKRTVVDVTDFGADPTGGADSTAAVVRAVAHARTLDRPVTISFPTGQYDLHPADAEVRELYVSNTVGADQRYRMKHIGILLEGMDDVIVDGNDSDLLLHGDMTPFAVIDSSDVSIVDLDTDWSAPTVVDLTVLRSGTEDGHGYRDVRLMPGARAIISGATATFVSDDDPATGEPYWSLPPSNAPSGWNQVRDLATGRTVRGGVPIWQGSRAVTEIEPGVLRVSYTDPADPGDAGKVYQMRQTTRTVPGAFISESTRVDLQRLDMSYLHGFGIVGQLSRDITLDSIRFRTESGRWASTASFADFVQMSSIAGVVQVTNSLFDNPHDDPINVHGTYLQVAEIDRANRTVTVEYMHNETAGFAQFHDGDEIRFVDRATMLPLEPASYRVETADGPDAADLRRITLRLDGELPEGLEVGAAVVENLTYTPEVLIAGNTFQSVPTRGILVTTPRKVVIERNRFDQMSMASIYVSADARSWYESGGVTDLTIRDNVFDRPSTSAPVIFFEPTNSARVEGRTVHRGVDIEHNAFAVRPGTRLIGAKSVSDLTFANNEITHYAPTQPVDPASVSTNELFWFDGAADVSLSGNEYAPGFNLRANTRNMDPAEIVADDGVVVNADNRTGSDAPRATLAEGFSWVREDASRWTAVDEGAITLRAGGSGLWATQNAAANILLTGQPRAGGTVLDVTMDGATAAGYEEAGLIVYTGDDDYVALQRKHAGGAPVIALVTESGGAPNEDTKVSAPAAETVQLRLERSGTTFTASYSTDGSTYTPIGSIQNSTVGDSARVGILAAGLSTGSGTPFTFSDFTIDDAAVPFFSNVPEPAALSLRAALGEVSWQGVEFGDPAAPLAWIADAPAEVRSVTARIPAAEKGTRVVVRHDDRVVRAKGTRYDFDLAAGPNVIQVETEDATGARQTYRWVIVSHQPYVDSIPTSRGGGKGNGNARG